MGFTDDEPIECDACGDSIYAGDTYQLIKKNGRTYCCCDSEDCMKHILFDLYEDEFVEMKLYTADDYKERGCEWDE